MVPCGEPIKGATVSDGPLIVKAIVELVGPPKMSMQMHHCLAVEAVGNYLPEKIHEKT